MIELHWACVPNPPGHRRPEWQRSAAIATDGTVFAPAAISGNETAVLLMAAFDGVPLVSDNGHLYLPASWLAQEFPADADVYNLIERRMKEHRPGDDERFTR